jgi:hypothetical protein
MMSRVRSSLAVSLLLAAACGSEDADTDTGGQADAGADASSTGAAVDAGPSDAGTGSTDGGASSAGDAGGASKIVGTVGNFSVRLVPPTEASGSTAATPGYVTVAGKVYSDLVPPDLLWADAMTSGDCKLLKPSAPFCEGGCASGSKCVADDLCQAYPDARDVGAITLTGVKTTDSKTSVSLTSVLGSYGAAGTTFAYPGVTEGEDVSLSAAGGSVAAFSVKAKGVTPLVLTTTSFKLDSTKPFALSWEKPGAKSDAKIRVHLDISHHGGIRGLLTCDTADDGALEIDASLVKGLIDLGVAGYPSIVVYRESVASTDIGAGSVELSVYANVEEFVEIDGVVSCTSSTDCPTGKTCNTDIKLCR